MDIHEHLVLFWSGGKDAYLALQEVQASPDRIRLLTTYNETTGVVPFQNIPIGVIEEQAGHLGLPLMKIPLPQVCPNAVYLSRVRDRLDQLTVRPVLVFGDLRLKDIRSWKEKVFGEMGYTCSFPIWNKTYSELLAILWSRPVEVYVTAVSQPLTHILTPGSKFDQSFVKMLPGQVDHMGENGEFHTVVRFAGEKITG